MKGREKRKNNTKRLHFLILSNNKDGLKMDFNNLEIKDYLKIINKRKFTIFIFFILVLVITVIVTFRMVPIYEATTKVLIEKKEANPLNNPFVPVIYFDKSNNHHPLIRRRT